MSAAVTKNERKDDQETKPASEEQTHLSSPQGRYVRLETRLGAGAYKDVWRAYDSIEGIEVAWTVVKLSRVPKTERKRIKIEIKLLKGLEHPNVIKYHNSWVNREREEIIFVTEIMSSGSLKDYIKKNPMIRWNAVKRWCRQILKGLEFLHENSIIHRDIKCDNIFINGSTGDIRIGDLGLSTKMAEGRDMPNEKNMPIAEPREVTGFAMTCLGTPEFMAPELYDENYNEMVDVYAFGMTCLEMVTSKTPYHECTSAPQIYKKVCAGELPPELISVRNENARKFIEACIQPQATRPTAAQLLAHPFLQENEAEDFLEVRVKLKKQESIKEETTTQNNGEELDRVSESEEEDESSDEDDDDVTGDEGIMRNATATATSQANGTTPEAGGSRNPQTESQPRDQSSAISNAHVTEVESNKDSVHRVPSSSSSSRNDQTSTSVSSPDAPTTKVTLPNLTTAPVVSKPTESSSLPPSPSSTIPPQLHVPSGSTRPPSTVPTTKTQRDSDLAPPDSHNIRSVSDDNPKSRSTTGDQKKSSSVSFGSDTEFLPLKKTLSGGNIGSRVLRVYKEGVYRCRSGSVGGSGAYETSDGMVRSQPIPIPSPGGVHGSGVGSGSGNMTTGSLTSQHSAAANSPSTGDNFVGVVDLEDKDTNSDSLIFRLRVPFGDTFKEVEFEYNLQVDEPNAIVEEMNEAEELVFMRPYAQEIVDSITPVVEVARRIAEEKAAAKLVSEQQQPLVNAPDLSLPYSIVLSSEQKQSTTQEGMQTQHLNVPIEQKVSSLSNDVCISNSPLSEMVIEKVLSTPGVYDDRALAALSNAVEERMHKTHHANVGAGHHHTAETNPSRKAVHANQSTATAAAVNQTIPAPPVIMRTLSDKHNHSGRPQLSSMRSLSASNIASITSHTGATSVPAMSNLDVSTHSGKSSYSDDNSTCSSPSSPNKLTVPFDFEQSPEGHVSSSDGADCSGGTAEELDQYNQLIAKFHENVAKVEKDFNHVTGNLNSQGEKLAETYKREYERVIKRKDDLTIQLHAMEDKYKERMHDLEMRREKLYQMHMKQHQSHQQQKIADGE